MANQRKYTGCDNSIEALYDVLNSCHVSEISTSLSQLANGIDYSFVEVIDYSFVEVSGR
jgi:hypothetical protein